MTIALRPLLVDRERRKNRPDILDAIHELVGDLNIRSLRVELTQERNAPLLEVVNHRYIKLNEHMLGHFTRRELLTHIYVQLALAQESHNNDRLTSQFSMAAGALNALTLTFALHCLDSQRKHERISRRSFLDVPREHAPTIALTSTSSMILAKAATSHLFAGTALLPPEGYDALLQKIDACEKHHREAEAALHAPGNATATVLARRQALKAGLGIA